MYTYIHMYIYIYIHMYIYIYNCISVRVYCISDTSAPPQQLLASPRPASSQPRLCHRRRHRRRPSAAALRSAAAVAAVRAAQRRLCCGETRQRDAPRGTTHVVQADAVAEIDAAGITSMPRWLMVEDWFKGSSGWNIVLFVVVLVVVTMFTNIYGYSLSSL